jgi:hypothetical protein
MWNAQKTREVHTGIWWGDLKERSHFEDLGVDGRVILKWIISESIGRTWNGLIWLVIGKNDAGCCEHGNETCGFIKRGGFFD